MNWPPPDWMTAKQRFWHGCGGTVLLGLLVVARCLPPSESGVGTHRALGLPPCTAITWLGIPCPTCGMTTSWAHLARGNLTASLATNPGGTCLAFIALFAGVWAISNALRGVYQPWISIRASGITALAITAITVIQWIAKIF